NIDTIDAAVCYLRAIRFDSPWSPVLLWHLMQAKAFFPRLKDRVDANDPRGEFIWAGLVAFGFDNQLTPAQALKLLERAAEQNFPWALAELGMCYYSGTWVTPDHDKAIDLMRRAVEAGSREANTRLCMIEMMTNKKSSS